MKNITQNEKGFAVPLAIMVMLVLILLGTALWYYSTSETLQVARAEQDMKAHYLARSGMDITQETLRREKDNLLPASDRVFYFSGTLLNNKTLTYATTQPNSTGKDVVIKVEWDASEKTGQIISTGYFHELNDKISCKFTYYDNEPLSAEDIGWIGNKGRVNNVHDNNIQEKPVVWTYSVLINDGNNSETLFAAPAMYFKDTHLNNGYVCSLKINANSSNLILTADYISFKGNILLDKPKSNSTTNLTLRANDSEISFANIAAKKDLKGQTPLGDTHYGLLYLGENLLTLDKSGKIAPLRAGLTKGYYLFPHGIMLGTNDDSKPLGLGSLIKITDEEAAYYLTLFDIEEDETGVNEIIFGDYSD